MISKLGCNKQENMESNLDCGTCKQNLCTHTVSHIEQLSIKLADLERRLICANALLDQVGKKRQNPDIKEFLGSDVISVKNLTLD